MNGFCSRTRTWTDWGASAKGACSFIARIGTRWTLSSSRPTSKTSPSITRATPSKTLSFNILRKFILWTAGLTAVFLLYACRLGFPPELYYDEIYHVPTARQILDGVGYLENTHPLLGKLLIALGIALFGDNAFAWRFWPCVLGAGCVPLVYLLGKQLFQEERAALAAAFLYGCENLSLTQGRIAMLNAPLLFFVLASVFCFLKYYLRAEWSRAKALLGTGLFLGLAVSVKWVAFFWAGTLGLFILYDWARSQDKGRYALEAFAFLIGLPLLIYALSWIPFVISSASGRTWADVISLQHSMFDYHLHLQAEHLYQSKWWTWPFLVRPIWYYFQSSDGIVRGVMGMGNPAVFWMIVPVLAALSWSAWKERSRVALFLLAAYAGQHWPYAGIGRIAFLQHFQPAVPFLCLALGFFSMRVWRWNRFGKILVIVYFTMVAAQFVYWYPLNTGWPVSEKFFNNHMWFPSWV